MIFKVFVLFETLIFKKFLFLISDLKVRDGGGDRFREEHQGDCRRQLHPLQESDLPLQSG
jgi:hypothetical protein